MGRDVGDRRSCRLYGSTGQSQRGAACLRRNRGAMKRKTGKVSAANDPGERGPKKEGRVKDGPAMPDAAKKWDAALLPVLQASPEFPKKFLKQLRGARLTFGRRVHCPFLRPFFLSPADETRVRRVAETIARVAERVTSAAMQDDS